MTRWIHTHCPNCNMPYPGVAPECGACGRVRDPLIVPPPVVEAARPETYRRSVPPPALRATPNDALTVAVAIFVAMVITYVRLNFGTIALAILIALIIIYVRLNFGGL